MRTPALACAAWLALGSLPALAEQTTAAMLGPSETMVSICAGVQNGSGFGPGGLVGMLPARSDCQSARTTVPSQVVSRSVAYDELPSPVQATASGQAQMGQMSFQTWMNGDNAYGLSMGSANAGWNDLLTIMPQDAALVGQIAYFAFNVHVTGSMSITNTANAGSGLSLLALRDDGFFGGSWVEQGFGVLGNPPVSKTVDTVATLYVAAPLGSAFELGVFGVAWSSGGSSLPGPNEAQNQFAVTWLGIQEVSVNGTPVAYSLTSLSGIDWTQPFAAPVPEPAAALLMLAGIAGLLLARRRGDAAADGG